MNLKLKPLLIAMLCSPLILGGCAPTVKFDIDSAKQRFKDNKLKNADEEDDKDLAQLLQSSDKPQSVLLQFKYGPQSLGSGEFRQVLSSLNADGSDRKLSYTKRELGVAELKHIEIDRHNQRRLLISREKQALLKKLDSTRIQVEKSRLPKKEVSINLRNVPLSTVLEELALQAGARIIFSNKSREQNPIVSVDLDGDPAKLFDKTITQYGLVYSYDLDTKIYRINTPQESRPQLGLNQANSSDLSAQSIAEDENLLVDQTLQLIDEYKQIVNQLNSGEELDFFTKISTLPAPKSKSDTQHKLYAVLVKHSSEIRQKLDEFDRHTRLRLKGYNFNKPQETKSEQDVMHLGTLDRCITPGQEIFTEKIYTYNEIPKTVADQLKKYTSAQLPPMFPGIPGQPGIPGTIPGQPGIPGAVPGQPVVPGVAPGQAGIPGGILGSIPGAIPGQPGLTGGIPGAIPGAIAGQPGIPIGIPGVLGALGQTIGPSGNPLPPGCFPNRLVIQDDATGVIATGTRQEVDLIKRLAANFDFPSKQVLVEVFLVEVEKNWARTIETKIGGITRTNSGQDQLGAVAGTFPSNAAPNITGNVIDTIATNNNGGLVGRFIPGKNQITAFINLLEQTNAGRKISSPTILAKDGEKASVKRERVVRAYVQENTTVPGGSGGNIIQTTQRLVELKAPLSLDITPKINQHNNHVNVKFKLEETVYDDTVTPTTTSATTSNSIDTNLETAPGDVIVLAGLFKESNARRTKGIPGLTSLGSIAGLLGGSDQMSTESSELLVFIAPTVIEPAAGKKQINSVR